MFQGRKRFLIFSHIFFVIKNIYVVNKDNGQKKESEGKKKVKNLKDFKYLADLSVGYLAYSPEYNLFKNLKKKPAYEKIMLLMDDKIGDFLRKEKTASSKEKVAIRFMKFQHIQRWILTYYVMYPDNSLYNDCYALYKTGHYALVEAIANISPANRPIKSIFGVPDYLLRDQEKVLNDLKKVK